MIGPDFFILSHFSLELMRTFRACIITLTLFAASLLMLCLPLRAHAQPSTPTPNEINWTYGDNTGNDTGPDAWANLSPDFATCASGKSQSPINLTATTDADLVNPDFHYERAPLNLLNNGHTVQVPYAPGSYLTLDGQRYNLLQFHFHSPSEHAVDGKPWDAELHMVHQSDDGELAVVAVLLQADDTEKNTHYQTLSANLPKKSGDKIRTGEMINAQSLLPTQTTTYRYSGSLTTPPCSESVTWLVMTEPVSLTSQQLASYKKLLNNNNRPLQLLNKRSVKIDISP